jgi:hypothetical protein
MNPSIQRFCACSGLVFIVLFMIAMMFVIPFIPPIAPTLSSAEIAQLFRDHSLGIRAASALMMYTCVFGWVWSASVATWTARMEGSMPVLSVAQVICGVFSFGGAYFVVIAWCSAVFRPNRPEELVYLMSDQGWFWIVLMGSCAVMQMILIGLAVLNDQSRQPVFPRWVGYFNIWVGVLQIPGVTVPFFKQGPFAWDGLLAFWVPLSTFSGWIFVTTWALLHAIRRETNA